MTLPTWYTGEILRPGFVDAINGTLSSTTGTMRGVVRGFEKAADLLGKTAGFLDALFIKGPQDALLDAVSGILQSLLNDLIETGAYVLFHHNLPEGALRMGLGNLAPHLRERLPPTATGIVGNEGTEEALQREALIASLPRTPPRSPIPSFQNWLLDISRAFDDPLDKRRPQVSQASTIGGFLWAGGGSTLVDVIDVLRVVDRVFRLAEAVQLHQGLVGSLLGGFDQDWDNLSRFRQGGMFKIIKDSTFGAVGVPPNFISVKAGQLVRDLGTLLVSTDTLKEALTLGDVATQATASLVRALEHRLRTIAGTLALIDTLISSLGNLVALQSAVSILPLPPEIGGIPHLQNRIHLSQNAPGLGPGNLIVGGGVFVTSLAAFETIAKLLFEGEGNPVLLPRGPQVSTNFEGHSEYGTGDRTARAGTQDAFFGGLQSGEGGSSRRGSYRSSGRPGDTSSGTLGSWIGGFLLRRNSWGTYQDELRRVTLVEEEGVSRFEEKGTGSWIEAHVAPDAPRLQVLPELLESGQAYRTGLLIEGRSFNAFPDSDRFRLATLQGLSRSEHPHSSPTSDLLEHRKEAGTSVRLTSTIPWGLGEAQTGIAGILEECGVRLRLTSGALSPTDLGKVLTGTQTCTIRGRTVEVPIHSTITEVLDDRVTLDRPLFVPPLAHAWEVSSLMLSETTEGITTWLKQSVQWYLRPWAFSVFARSRSRSPWLQGMVALYDVPSAQGPRYGVHAHLFQLFSRALHSSLDSDGSYVGGLFTLPPSGSGSPPLERGDIITLERTSGVVRDLRIAESVTDTPEVVSFLALPLSDPEGTYLDQTVDAGMTILKMNARESWAGFSRVSLDLPSHHREQTSPIAGGIPLSLSHVGIKAATLEVWILGVSGPVPLTSSQWSLSSSGVGGRSALVLTPPIASLYTGRRVEVRYPLPYPPQGEIWIAPGLLKHQTGMVPNPPPGTTLDLWRGQWEAGFMTSSIPSRKEGSRTREPDQVELREVARRLREGRTFISLTFYPNVGSSLLEEPMTILYFQSDLTLELQPEGELAKLVLTSGDLVFASTPFPFLRGDRITLQIDWQEAALHWKIFRNGASLLEQVTSSFSSLDSLLSPSATLRVGSRPDHMRPGWFTLYDFSLKESPG
jgi:hypothetical protein